jgi:thymidylate synthase (FAD)
MMKSREERRLMHNITIRSDFDVELVEWMGSDEMICKAARVSTLGAASIDSKESAGLINFLMSNRHGTPFEHSSMMFRIGAPIVVWREFMRHRIGISYNEQSGRYMELFPEFYIPPTNRNLVQVGKPGHYEFVPGDKEQHHICSEVLFKSYKHAWDGYQLQLTLGVAKEVARLCLPVSIYSTAYVTMNPRSMMNFLSLRTKHEDSKFPSYPMWEINQVADKMETIFAEKFPITHEAFHKVGRVAP